MRFISFLFIFMLMSSIAYAADPTTSMLDAPYVDKFITLSLGPDNNGKTIVKYTLDTFTNDSPRSTSGLTFRSDGEIAIHLQNLNPLSQSWMVEAKATPDVSYAAIKAFLDDLNTLKSALPQQPAGGSPAGGAAPGVDPCASTTNCDRLNCRIKIAYKALTAPDLTPSDLQKIITEANGFAGVTTAANDLANAQAQIDNNVKAARDGLEKIRTDFGSLPQAGPAQCPQVTGQILVDYLDVHSTAGQIIAKKEALKKDLGDLVTILQPYLQQNVWRGPTFSDYEIRTVNPTFTEQQAVSVTAKARTVQLVSSTIVIKTDDANLISTKFDVRKSSFFVAERAAAVIYNNITYPQYGTTTNASGQTVVKRTKDHEPIGGALMLNLVMRLGRGASVAHPLLQFGVSSAKEFPGFLAGIGVRFVEPFNFSLSVGGMITRYKDLDGELKVGDPASGTADINKHLVYKTSPVAIYGAMQLKF